MRSSIPQASDATSEYFLPKTVMPTFFKPIGFPAAATTPRSQALFSDIGFTTGLAFCPGFFAAGAPGGISCAGGVCADAVPAQKDSKTAATKLLIMTTRRMEDGEAGLLE